MTLNKLVFLAPLALLAGCSNIATLESRHFSNEKASVSISYSIDMKMDNADDVSALERERAQHESDFAKMGFVRTTKAEARSLMCVIEVIDPDKLSRIVTCTKRQGVRQIQFSSDNRLYTMFAFIFPDDFKKLVPNS